MALVKGTNSYVTVDEADAYFAESMDVAAWSVADNTMKAQALVTATRILDEMSWIGTAISESQPLAFPRFAEYFDPRLGTYKTIDGNAVPDRITKAQVELAYHLLNNDGLQDDSGTVTNINIGSIALQDIKRPRLIPLTVKRYINPLLVNGGSNGWWRFN